MAVLCQKLQKKQFHIFYKTHHQSHLDYRAAFQYGVKMSDGRKTRRAGPKDEKAELDRQWQQIQNIMNKRKGDGYGDGGGKKSKY